MAYVFDKKHVYYGAAIVAVFMVLVGADKLTQNKDPKPPTSTNNYPPLSVKPENEEQRTQIKILTKPDLSGDFIVRVAGSQSNSQLEQYLTNPPQIPGKPKAADAEFNLPSNN